jgi:hypothetical protein
LRIILLESKSPDVWKRARRRYVYRIYTEDKNLSEIKLILEEYFKGFSIFDGKGSWKGIEEKSLLIEIEGANASKIRIVAAKIKSLNRQESVLVSRNPVQSILV